MAQLQTDRVPPGARDLAQGWTVQVQSVSTLGETMYFRFSMQAPKFVPVASWDNLPTVPPGNGSQGAAQALNDLLFYSKSVLGS